MMTAFRPLRFSSERLAFLTIKTMNKVQETASEIRRVASSSNCTELEKKWVCDSADKLALVSYQTILNSIATNEEHSAESLSYSLEGYEKLCSSVNEDTANFESTCVTIEQIYEIKSSHCADEVSARRCLRLLDAIEQSLNSFARRIRNMNVPKSEKNAYFKAIGLLLNFLAEGKFAFYLFHQTLIPNKFWRGTVNSYFSRIKS